MELRHLKYFIMVAEELHFGRAAKRLNISQPPLSQQIKQLEQELNITLFNRTNRSVELTVTGEVFLEKSRKILNYINNACEEAQGVDRGEIGELVLAFGGSAAFDLLPTIIQTCNKLLPNITLDLIQLTTSEQIKALEESRIHVGLLVSPIESSLIDTEMLRTESFVVCLPDYHPLAKRNGPINAIELANEKFIMPPMQAGKGYYDAINKIYEDAGFTPNVVQTAKEQHTMVSLVAAGIGIVIVPESTQFIKLEGIVYKLFNKPYIKVNSIAWNKDNKHPVVKAFLKLMREIIIPKYN
ncbi:LysR family transcriptional regulator [Metabacillus herbersteinensis]|uniref:LysR family transcriptional regulator n=1 Tax=Metabacillus herbersteinensis TaxID=283816 RepID=A0ABV6GDS2_9BACI